MRPFHYHQCPHCRITWMCFLSDCPGGAVYCCARCYHELFNIADGKNPAAVALGRLGGLKGGNARAKKMTPEERSEAARKAANVRWNSNKED